VEVQFGPVCAVQPDDDRAPLWSHPRAVERGWLGVGPTVVVSVDVADLTVPELRHEILKLRRRVQKLTALLRLVLTLLRASVSRCRVSGCLMATTRGGSLARQSAREFVPLQALLRVLRLSPSRFHAWRRPQHRCALDDQSSCPHTSPHPLTSPEVQAIRDMVTSPEYRAVPTNILHLPARVVVTAADHLSSWMSRNISSS
jgi:hypothetical protein